MHDLEPYYGWDRYYNSVDDEHSPFYGKEHSLFEFTDNIYGYCIHPQWDNIGSETLYLKILYVDYEQGFAIIEMLGEWNDTLHNDIMHLKRNIIDHFLGRGINKFILFGESVFNFHGSDDSYYEEWFEDVEEGWVAALNFHDFVMAEWKKFHIDYFFNFGGNLELPEWRTLTPQQVYFKVNQGIMKRLE